jgi:cell division septum initiation protein DivIVA
MNPSLSFTLLALVSTGVAGLDLRQDPETPPVVPAPPSPRSDIDDLFDVEDEDLAPEIADVEDEPDVVDEIEPGDEVDAQEGAWELFSDEDGDESETWLFQGEDAMEEHQERMEELREALEEQREALEESRQAFEESRREWADSQRAHAELAARLAAGHAKQADGMRAKALKLREKAAQHGQHAKVAAPRCVPGRAGLLGSLREVHPRAPAVIVRGGKGGGRAAASGDACRSGSETKCESTRSEGCATPAAPRTPATPASPGVTYWRNGDGESFYGFDSGKFAQLSDYAKAHVDTEAIKRAVEEARAAGLKAGAYSYDGNGLVSLGDLSGVWNFDEAKLAGLDAEAVKRAVEEARAQGAYAAAVAEHDFPGVEAWGGGEPWPTPDSSFAAVPEWGAPSAPAPAGDTMQELTELLREMSSEVRGLRDDLRSLRADLQRDVR